jgi:hypothetical protein
MIWRILWPAVVSAFLALVSVNFFLGLPGAFFIDVLVREEAAKIGPGAWALAIHVSAFACFGVAPAIWAMMIWRPLDSTWRWTLAACAGYLAAGAFAALNMV